MVSWEQIHKQLELRSVLHYFLNKQLHPFVKKFSRDRIDIDVI
jgi:hypothetical protein